MQAETIVKVRELSVEFDNPIQPENYECTIVVEGEEDVTGPAGTLSCFKIVTSEGGEVVKTEWFSEEVKNVVKVVDAATFASEETWELEAY